MLLTMYVDACTTKFIFAICFLWSHFLLATKHFETPWQNGCSYKKGSLGRDMPSIGTLVSLLLALTWQAASALLGLSSLTSSCWHGLCQWLDWAPYQLGACTLAPWDRSWSLQGHKPNSAASSTSGSLNIFFAIYDWHAAMCWLVLGGPWKACLLPQKTGQSSTRRFL